MGAGVSQERLKELHWGRDVSKLFNCAKMVDQVSCHPKFFTSLVADSGTLFYCAISEDGRVVGISHDTLAHECVVQLQCASVQHVQSVRSAVAVVCSDGVVFALRIANGQFECDNFSIPNAALALGFREKFVVVTSDCACFLCEVGGHVDEVWGKRGGVPRAAAVSESRGLVFVSLDGKLVVGQCAAGSERVCEFEAPTFSKMVSAVEDDVVCVDASGDSVFGVSVPDDLSECAVDKLFDSSQVPGVVDIAVCDKLVFGITQKQLVFVWGSDMELHTKDVRTDPVALLVCQEAKAGVIITRDNSIIVFKMQVSEPIRLIRETFTENIETATLLEGLHKDKICGAVHGEEFSFMTCDESGRCILWESIPDWWDAPFVQSMFVK